MNKDPAGMMGIIGCKLFEDELAYLFSRDEGLEHLLIVENEESKGLLRKLMVKEHRFTIDTIDEGSIPSLDVPGGFSIFLWIKPMALHQKPEKLREDIADSIRMVQDRCGVILLFYGLCGNAFKRMDTMTEDISVPVIILRDHRGEVIDDCIGAVLGGTTEYYEQLKKSSGTFFLTPMWAENWRELFHKVQILTDPNDIVGAKYVFDCVGYKNVIKLDTGLGNKEKFDQQIDEFATLFGFKKSVVNCTLKVVEASYDEARGRL